MKEFRTTKTQKQYDDYISRGGLDDGCHICEEESLEKFDYWRTINNKFPYDNIADLHEMLVPKRHIDEQGLNREELHELPYLKRGYVSDYYDAIVESTVHSRTIPNHFHIHLINFK